MSSRRLPLQPLAQQSTLQEGTVENRSVNNRNEREETGNNNMANIVTIDDDNRQAIELNETASPRRIADRNINNAAVGIISSNIIVVVMLLFRYKR